MCDGGGEDDSMEILSEARLIFIGDRIVVARKTMKESEIEHEDAD